MRAHPLLFVLVLAVASPVAAQWSVGVSAGIARYYGATGPAVDSEDASVRPYRPTTVAVVVGREWGALRVDLGLSYGQPGLAAEVPLGAFITTKDATFYALSPDVAFRLVRVGQAGALRVGAGADFTLWRMTGFDDRIKPGGHVTVAYEWPVAGRFLGALTVGAVFSPSVFESSELPAELERRMMVRPSVTIGIRYH